MELTTEQIVGYLNQMLAGAILTVELFVASFLGAFLLGIIIGVVTLSKNRIIRFGWKIYASIFTGVPSILIIFLLYYGGSAMLTGIFGKSRSFDVTSFGAGVAALSIVYAAYIAELLHGAVANLPRGQFEAAAALGIKRYQAWIYIIFPQLFRLALPGMVVIWINVLKETPLVSLAGLNELVAISKISAGATKEPFLFFIVAALFYIVCSGMTQRVALLLERRLSRGYAEARL